MLPLSAFPVHYDPAARCNQSCHLIRSGLGYQIQRSAAAWPLRSEQTGSKVRIAGNPPGTSLPLCRLWDQPVNLNASMMCGAKLNEKICECSNAQDEFKGDA